jgi:hypothetical protein
MAIISLDLVIRRCHSSEIICFTSRSYPAEQAALWQFQIISNAGIYYENQAFIKSTAHLIDGRRI